jgi:DNA-binding NarL/FixJ family response regulator
VAPLGVCRRLYATTRHQLGAQLPPRLRRLFELYLTGLSEKEAADRLHLSWETVHSYTRDLHRKLGVGSRAQLLATVLRTRE